MVDELVDVVKKILKEPQNIEVPPQDGDNMESPPYQNPNAQLVPGGPHGQIPKEKPAMPSPPPAAKRASSSKPQYTRGIQIDRARVLRPISPHLYPRLSKARQASSDEDILPHHRTPHSHLIIDINVASSEIDDDDDDDEDKEPEPPIEFLPHSHLNIDLSTDSEKAENNE